MIIDRRRSDTDALNSMSDVKLVRQKLLKYAHVKSQDSTDSDSTTTTLTPSPTIEESRHVNGKVSYVNDPTSMRNRTFTSTIHVPKRNNQN